MQHFLTDLKWFIADLQGPNTDWILLHVNLIITCSSQVFSNINDKSTKFQRFLADLKPFARYTWKFFNSDVSGSLSVHLIPLQLNSHGIFQVITSTWESHLICSFLLSLNGGGSWPSLRRNSKFNATLIFLLQEKLWLLTITQNNNTSMTVDSVFYTEPICISIILYNIIIIN